MRYRSDIDGLRAIAISPVVLLHAGIPGFSGGFVGVDIFFVISGFLITALNLRHVENGTFSLVDFYDRRIRRIFPALIAVYIFCLILGLLLSMPIDLKEFAKSLTSSAVFVSNMHFYQLAGYFDAPSLSKPLLHSWSLSVEEQFYILWPIAMIALWRFAKPSRRVTIMAIAIAVSLAYAEWEIRRGNQSAAFYLLPARVWELLAGALLAIVIPHLRIGPRLAEIAALGGFALIVGAVVGLSEQRDFPRLNAVIPCAGAVLLILAGHDRSTAVTRIISSRGFVFVGVISYSLYLWHWPLAFDRTPLMSEACALIGVSIVMAVLSQRFIEQPFRQRLAAPRRTVYAGVGAMALCVVAGVAISSTKGLPQRFHGDVAEIFALGTREPDKICVGDPNAEAFRASRCLVGAPKQSASYDAALLGDSHAGHFGSAVDIVLRNEHLSGRLVSRFGFACAPFAGVRAMLDGRELTKCASFPREFAAFLAENKQLKLVIIALRWDTYTREDGSGARGQNYVKLVDDIDPKPSGANASGRVLERSLRTLVGGLVANGKQVLLIGQVPPYLRTPMNCVAKAVHHESDVSRCFVPVSQVRQQLDFSNGLLRRLAAESDAVHAFLPTDILCDEKSCSPLLNSVFLYRDNNHLNTVGAREFAEHFARIPVFSQLRGTPLAKSSAVEAR